MMDGMTSLTKQRHVLDLVFDATNLVRFHQPEEEGDEFYRGWILTRESWEDMGSPKHITITVEPGDLLNQPED